MTSAHHTYVQGSLKFGYNYGIDDKPGYVRKIEVTDVSEAGYKFLLHERSSKGWEFVDNITDLARDHEVRYYDELKKHGNVSIEDFGFKMS